MAAGGVAIVGPGVEISRVNYVSMDGDGRVVSVRELPTAGDGHDSAIGRNVGGLPVGQNDRALDAGQVGEGVVGSSVESAEDGVIGARRNIVDAELSGQV